MINPRLGILGLGFNPRRKKKPLKKGKKTMARRRRRASRSRAHMAWVRSFRRGRKASPRRRHRRARRNPWPVGGMALNPRRRRRGRRRYNYAHNPRRRRRSYRRNPSLLSLRGLPPLQSVIFAGVGFVGTPILEGTLGSFLPLSITGNTIGKYGVRIASVLGLTWLAKMVVGGGAARMVGIGGGAYVLVTAVKEFAPGLIPGMAAYTLDRPGMSAYVPGTNRTFNTMGAPVLPFRSTGTAVEQSRFSRF
jgi:hypothetical protein